MTKRIAALLVAIVATALLAAPAAADPPPDTHCPGKPGAPAATIIAEGGASGSITVDGVTISWSGTTVIISGGTVTFCVKGGTSGNSGSVTLGPGTYSTADLGLLGPQGQAQDISYLVVYDTTPPVTTTEPTTPPTTTEPTTPPPTTSTPPPTTEPPPSTSTPPPTTITPPETTTRTRTLPPGTPGFRSGPPGTAFTGPEDVIPWVVAALLLLSLGSGALWLGFRRGR